MLDTLRKEYIAMYNLKNYIYLNAGYCIKYANEAVQRLKMYGINAEVVKVVGYLLTEKLNTELRFDSRNIQSIGVWNKKLLNKYNGTTHIDDFFKGLLSPSNHAWIYFNGKHYDAETIKGVSNFFDFPYYRFFTSKNHIEKIKSQERLNRETLEILLESPGTQVNKFNLG